MFHLWAFVAAIAAGVALVVLADGAVEVVSSWVYAVALAAMFGRARCTTAGRWRSAAKRLWARRLDHSMIFVFIAGTYTPFALLRFQGMTHWLVLVLVWVGAVLGLVLELVWIDSPRWLSAAAYLVRRLGRRPHDPAAVQRGGGRRRRTPPGRRRAVLARRGDLRHPVAESVPAGPWLPRVFRLLVVAAAVTQFVAVSLVVM